MTSDSNGRAVSAESVTSGEGNGASGSTAKDRTRRLLVEAAHALLREGSAVSVQSMAQRAGVSRATAYRYFPNNEAAVMAATSPELDETVLAPLSHDDPDDERSLAERAVDLVRSTGEWAFDHEDELRGVLALTVTADSRQRGITRKGISSRAGWIEDLLEDLPASVTAEGRRRLSLALIPLFGADAVVWTRDLGELERAEALDVLGWMARSLVDAAIADYDRGTA